MVLKLKTFCAFIACTCWIIFDLVFMLFFMLRSSHIFEFEICHIFVVVVINVEEKPRTLHVFTPLNTEFFWNFQKVFLQSLLSLLLIHNYIKDCKDQYMKVKETKHLQDVEKLKVKFLKNTCLEFPDFYFEYSSVKR